MRTALPLVYTHRISASEKSKDFHADQDIASAPARPGRAHFFLFGEMMGLSTEGLVLA